MNCANNHISILTNNKIKSYELLSDKKSKLIIKAKEPYDQILRIGDDIYLSNKSGKIFNCQTEKEYHYHQQEITNLQVISNRFLLSSSRDSKMILYDMKRDYIMHQFNNHSCPIISMDYNQFSISLIEEGRDTIFFYEFMQNYFPIGLTKMIETLS